MPQINVLLDEKEDKVVNDFSDKWKLSKIETIKRILREFKEVK